MEPAPIGLAQKIRDAARELGFVRVAFCPATPFKRGEAAWRAWIEAGHHGDMGYMAGPADRANPQELLTSAKTLIVVAMPYHRTPPSGPAVNASPTPQPTIVGRVARYAWGEDYHRVFKCQLGTLAESISTHVQRPVAVRSCVDSAPLLEREAAERSGLGFIAKNTMAIVPGVGSYVLLGELLIDVELPPEPPARSRCGTCRACLDACPTDAFVDSFVLDARRCISYLTIEYDGIIPRDLRTKMGRWIFGCDVCQEVCPFNASPKTRTGAFELGHRAELSTPDLIAFLRLTSSAYRRLVRGSAMRRVSRHQLARNAAIALGNSGDTRAVFPLVEALQHASRGLVRGHCAWALGQLGDLRARPALTHARQNDPDPFVAEECDWALSQLNAD